MIHSVFVSNKSRNLACLNTPLRPADLAALGIEPMNARSVVLSALLGTHPPRLPARSLVALAELFGIRAGTTRTSLSRMVTNGELHSADGEYGLAGRLLERQRQQDEGRVYTDEPRGAQHEPWNGDWMVAVASSDRRSMAERRAFRESMVGSRLAELRPDIWMRPANAPSPPRSPDVLVTVGPLDCDDVDDLVARLWPLDEIEASARRLADALIRQRSVISNGHTGRLPQTFMVSAAAVRFLRTEPRLPADLAPTTWTAPELRPHYDEFNTAFLGQLRDFFASVD
jgi:phenylacetic acid degradation operon negative regulatory protein